jgi:hypothetical protein
MDTDTKICSQLCEMSFDDATSNPDVIQTFTKIGLDITKARFTKDHNSVCLSYDQGAKLFIAWRGTANLQNLLEDLNIDDVRLVINSRSYGRVHRGMLRYYEYIKDEVFEQISAHVATSLDEVVFTGYSLGACVCFAALECAILYPHVRVSCITFASPLLGNDEFVYNFNTRISNSIRIVLDADYIPRIYYGHHFKHVRGGITIKTGISFAWIWVIIGIVQVMLKLYSGQTILSYHSMDTYLKYIQ